MRKFISMLLAVCLFVTFASPAMATEDSNAATPRYAYISTLSGNISINSSGMATCTAQSYAVSTDFEVQLNLQLQGYNGTNWRLCKSWSTIDTGVAVLSKTAATSSDYTDYRVQITCKIYDSSYTLLESVTIYDYA